MEFYGAQATITPNLLRIMQTSGVQWGVLVRMDSTLEEAQRYAYGNTLVFPVTGDDTHVFLVAMTKGGYAQGQMDRYGSGLWGAYMADDYDDAMRQLEERVLDVGNRLMRRLERT